MEKQMMCISTPIGILKVESMADDNEPGIIVKMVPTGAPGIQEIDIVATKFNGEDIVTTGVHHGTNNYQHSIFHDIRFCHFYLNYNDVTAIKQSDDVYEFLMVHPSEKWLVLSQTINLNKFLDGEKRQHLENAVKECGYQSINAVFHEYGPASKQILASCLVNFAKGPNKILFEGSIDECKKFINTLLSK